MRAFLPASQASGWALGLRLAVALLTLLRMVWTLQAWITRGSLGYLLGVALLVLAGCGLGFWWLEPTVKTLGDGMWLAFTTAATVGFGDVVPSTHASRAFSVLVVLLGLAVLSLVTASLSALFVEKEVEDEERQIEKDLMREIRHLRHEVADLRRDIQTLSATDRPGDH